MFTLYRTFLLANSNKNKICFVCDINKPPQEYAWGSLLAWERRLSQMDRIMHLDLIASLPTAIGGFDITGPAQHSTLGPFLMGPALAWPVLSGLILLPADADPFVPTTSARGPSGHPQPGLSPRLRGRGRCSDFPLCSPHGQPPRRRPTMTHVTATCRKCQG